MTTTKTITETDYTADYPYAASFTKIRRTGRWGVRIESLSDADAHTVSVMLNAIHVTTRGGKIRETFPGPLVWESDDCKVGIFEL